MRRVIKGALVGLMMAAPLPVMAQQTSNDDLYEQLDIMVRIFEHVRNDYVDEVDQKEVIEAAIQGMLKSLDPHSSYMNLKAYEGVQIQMQGEYGGLGIEVQMDKGLVKVVSPIDDTPADRAGILGGDYISHIDGDSIQGKTLTDAVAKMRGKAGDPIVITVLREGEKEPFDVTIIRDKIKVQSVRHRVEEDTIGYLRIATFNMQTTPGMLNSIEKLKAELGDKMEGLVLDLRNNPGGMLREAISVSDAFLEGGEIVSTRGRHRVNNNRWYAKAGDLLDGLPIVVLTNAYSASASEIVAGALQDHKRAIILGDRSFGKGTVQTEIQLGQKRDRAIRITTARYYTPSGSSIQGRGIEPDIEVLFPFEKRMKSRRESDLLNTISNTQDDVDRAGEVDELPKEVVEDKVEDTEANSRRPVVDIQLKYAVKLLKGLNVIEKPIIASANSISIDENAKSTQEE